MINIVYTKNIKDRYWRGELELVKRLFFNGKTIMARYYYLDYFSAYAYNDIYCGHVESPSINEFWKYFL